MYVFLSRRLVVKFSYIFRDVANLYGENEGVERAPIIGTSETTRHINFSPNKTIK